ncbi:ABC transporter permease [Labrys neptuniae]
MTDHAVPIAAGNGPEAAVPISPLRQALARLGKNRGFTVGAAILVLVILASFLLPLVLPYAPDAQDLAHKFTPPVWDAKGNWQHPLGTDHLGRDVLASLLAGGRVSLLIGFSTAMLSLFIGTALGVCAGYWGGKVDLCINFVLTVRLTLPVMLVALVVVAVIGNSLPLLVAVIGGLLWDRIAIVTRTATQQLARRDFVTAARAIGSSQLRILTREILPNLLGPIIVIGTVELAHAVLLEAALSFLGLGVQAPLTSWGVMIAESKNQLFFRPWLIAIPGVALVALVLAINLLGDALSDALAPDGRA